MFSLDKLQSAFAASLQGQELAIDEFIKPGGLSGEQRMQIYQNNYLISCRDALKATYHLTLLLIGETCFNQLARRWVINNPPNSGNIIEYGEGFATWLASLDQLSSLPYLADFAVLEWQIEQTSNMALNETKFPFGELAEVDGGRYGQLTFQLAPQFTLVASQYAIGEIYHMLQRQQVEAFDYNQPTYLLLQKQPDFTVQLHQLEPLAFQFLSACQQGMTLVAISEVMAVDPSIYLQQFIQQGVLNRFVCKEI